MYKKTQNKSVFLQKTDDGEVQQRFFSKDFSKGGSSEGIIH